MTAEEWAERAFDRIGGLAVMPLQDLKSRVAAAIRDAIAEEREACACVADDRGNRREQEKYKIYDKMRGDTPQLVTLYQSWVARVAECEHIAAAIRARGTATGGGEDRR